MRMRRILRNLPARIGVDVVIGDDQQEQEDAQHVRENGQLHVGDHSGRDAIKQPRLL